MLFNKTLNSITGTRDCSSMNVFDDGAVLLGPLFLTIHCQFNIVIVRCWSYLKISRFEKDYISLCSQDAIGCYLSQMLFVNLAGNYFRKYIILYILLHLISLKAILTLSCYPRLLLLSGSSVLKFCKHFLSVQFVLHVMAVSSFYLAIFIIFDNNYTYYHNNITEAMAKIKMRPYCVEQ